MTNDANEKPETLPPQVEAVVTLRFTCEPRKGHFSKVAPALPPGCSWQVGMHFDAEEFGAWSMVRSVSVDKDGNVSVWLEDAEDEQSEQSVAEYYAGFGWSK